jgi:hypothetical protein
LKVLAIFLAMMNEVYVIKSRISMIFFNQKRLAGAKWVTEPLEQFCWLGLKLVGIALILK